MPPLESRFAPPPEWRDPRQEAGFEPGHFPRCDGGEPPKVGAEELRDRQRLEFLAAYYEINRAYFRLESADARERSAAMLALNAALFRRDQLEDRYAPIGFFGEPVVEGSHTVDVQFMHAPDDPPRTPSLQSFAFTFPAAAHSAGVTASQTLDTAGFLRFLEQQIEKTGANDGKTTS